jgi:hypothetical protein
MKKFLRGLSDGFSAIGRSISFAGKESNQSNEELYAPFRPLDTTERCVAAWGGVLPRAPYCNHSVFVYDIRRDCPTACPGGYEPFRTAPNHNIEVVLGYRYTPSPGCFRLLFRAQYDFRLPKTSLREVSQAVAMAIALEMHRANSADVLLHYNAEFWQMTIAAAYRAELREACRLLGISVAEFELNSDFYRRQYVNGYRNPDRN